MYRRTANNFGIPDKHATDICARVLQYVWRLKHRELCKHVAHITDILQLESIQ